MTGRTKRFRFWAVVTLLVGVLSFLAAGCGGGDNGARRRARSQSSAPERARST